tara:strand:- start:155 stop:406 length:252 start_codon:yes stop_codon:yes gene_type:complete
MSLYTVIEIEIVLDQGPTSAPFRHRHLIWYVPEEKLRVLLKHPTTPGKPVLGTDKGDQLEPPSLDTSNSISVIAARQRSFIVG